MLVVLLIWLLVWLVGLNSVDDDRSLRFYWCLRDVLGCIFVVVWGCGDVAGLFGMVLIWLVVCACL